MTFMVSASFDVFGNWITGSGITYSGTQIVNFKKAGTQTFTSAGKTITFALSPSTYLTTLSLADPLVSTGGITATDGGTFSGNNQTVTLGTIAVADGGTLNLGNADWTFTGSSIMAVANGGTVNSGTSNITHTGNSGTFNGGGQSYNKFTIAGSGTGTITIGGNNTFTEIESTRTNAYTLNNNDTQTVGAFNVSGSAGNLVTLTASNAQIGTLISTGGQVSVDYLNISKSYVSPSATWYAGANSTNSRANHQWNFTVPPPPSLSSGNFFMLMYP
jgi:hypothetical protein